MDIIRIADIKNNLVKEFVAHYMEQGADIFTVRGYHAGTERYLLIAESSDGSGRMAVTSIAVGQKEWNIPLFKKEFCNGYPKSLINEWIEGSRLIRRFGIA